MVKKRKTYTIMKRLAADVSLLHGSGLYIVGKDKTALVSGVKMKAGEMVVNKKPIQVVFPPFVKRSSIYLHSK